jgi:hypothetical protein
MTEKKALCTRLFRLAFISKLMSSFLEMSTSGLAKIGGGVALANSLAASFGEVGAVRMGVTVGISANAFRHFYARIRVYRIFKRPVAMVLHIFRKSYPNKASNFFL